MRYVVTGASGFIGTATALRLLRDGHDVVGIDSLNHYYDPARKIQNLAELEAFENFTFFKRDINDGCEAIVEGADVILHLAGQPGVRKSWLNFTSYSRANIEATKHVLDLALRFNIKRVVYASSSSVYGNAVRYPCSELDAPIPASPYAVTKLAGEQLCQLFAHEHGLSTASLRYFTVYGPRQRPDMLTHRLIDAASTGEAITIFGDGEQIRDFTFVDDIARANIAASTADVANGSVFNIAGGSAVSVKEMIKAVENATGKDVLCVSAPHSAGDVDRTGADTSRARDELGWTAQVPLEQGLTAHVEKYRSRRHDLSIL